MTIIENLVNQILNIFGRDKTDNISLLIKDNLQRSFFSLKKGTNYGVIVIKNSDPLAVDEIEEIAFLSYLAYKNNIDHNSVYSNEYKDARIYRNAVNREAATFAKLFMFEITSLILTKHEYKTLLELHIEYSFPFSVIDLGLSEDEEEKIQTQLRDLYKEMKKYWLPIMEEHKDGLLYWLELAHFI